MTPERVDDALVVALLLVLVVVTAWVVRVLGSEVGFGAAGMVLVIVDLAFGMLVAPWTLPIGVVAAIDT